MYYLIKLIYQIPFRLCLVLENLRENASERKQKRKIEEK